MAYIYHVFLGILILQLYVNAAPNDVGKLEDIAKVEQADSTLEAGPVQLEDEENSTETSRQKRYYNPFGFPPFSPSFYPNLNVGDFEVEDPLSQIRRRVEGIANVVRQPPPPPHIPIFIPVLFVPPPFDCRCDTSNTQPTDPITPNNNETSPNFNVTTRFPAMEDVRQNWGIAVNDSAQNNNDDDGQDFSRPISFDPIRLDRPNSRPPPSVEREILQGGTADNEMPQSPQNSPPPPPSRPSTNRPQTSPFNTQRPPFNPQPSPFNPQPSPFNPQSPPPPFSQNQFPSGPPTACDGAILTCCHRLQVTYDCFAIQGCPNFTSYGNPCANYNLILGIIERFQKYYGGRS